MQLGAAAALGGSGPVTVANAHSTTIDDASAASSSSGVAVALAPTAPATLTGVTAAQSGQTTAIGATIANAVNTADQAAVQVQGANQAAVNVASSNNVAIEDTGAAGTTSGAAWAVAAGAAGAPSNVSTPVTGGAAPTSAPVSATGIQANNVGALTTSSTVVSPGGSASTAPINITPAEVAAYTTGGSASTISGAASGSAPATTSGTTQAASGTSQAQGVVAQNNVQTNAKVAVNIAGQNFAPITVIINSITQIFNWGAASATSGDAVASGSSSGTTTAGTTSAASGSAQSTGAQVANTVNLGSSAAVHVTGNNYNPINILLNLTANLVNWGVATATSGDAQSSGSGGGTATSGAASATGLRAVNLVSMWADASVDIDGNNYAPISIDIEFNTNIANVGYAGSSSGNAAAGQSASGGSSGAGSSQRSASGSSAGGSTTSGSSSGSTSRAQGGNAVAVSNSVSVGAVSDQLSSANGGNSIATTAVVQMLQNLPSGTWDPFVQQNLPDTAAPAATAGISSSSGNSTAVGLQSSIGATNGQLAACADPGENCTAINSSSMTVSMHDLAYNPATNSDGTARGSGDQDGGGSDGGFGPGGTSASSGFSGVNATPTPKASATSGGSGSDAGSGVDQGQTYGDVGDDGTGGGNGGGGTRHFFAVNAVAGQLAANGQLVMVDLWDEWPGRRLPPMPNPLKSSVSSSTIDATLPGLPGGVDELPLPMPGTRDVSTASSGSVRGAAAASRRQVGPVSLDLAVGDGQDAVPPLDVVDVDLWSRWPATEAMPMPLQVLPAPSVGAEQAAPVAAAATSLPPDSGALPMQLDLAALLATLTISLRLSTRYGRGLLAALSSWFNQRRRAHFLLRLASGMLRLW